MAKTIALAGFMPEVAKALAKRGYQIVDHSAPDSGAPVDAILYRSAAVDRITSITDSVSADHIQIGACPPSPEAVDFPPELMELNVHGMKIAEILTVLECSLQAGQRRCRR